MLMKIIYVANSVSLNSEELPASSALPVLRVQQQPQAVEDDVADDELVLIAIQVESSASVIPDNVLQPPPSQPLRQSVRCADKSKQPDWTGA
jgi:hypothetical protein